MIMENVNAAVQVSVGVAGGLCALIVAIILFWEIVAIDIHKEARDLPDSVPEEDREHMPEQFDRVEKLMHLVHEGAVSFLNKEYTYLLVFVIVVAIAIACALIRDDKNDPNGSLFGVFTMICFLVGAGLSGAAGYIGMLVATEANGRTTMRCVQSMTKGLAVSFASGAVMSNVVVGFGIVGVAAMYGIFSGYDNVWSYVSGFGFGASSVALFARVGGGVFTKAADVGADLVGKVEAAIPEDDPRNPATIADNVGDNVGDVAGMGADLFESFVGSLIATASLAATQFDGSGERDVAIATPFWIAGFGIMIAILGTYIVRLVPIADDASLGTLLRQINMGIGISAVLTIVLTIVTVVTLWGADNEIAWQLFGCVLIGLVAGIIIGQFTEFMTSYEQYPTRGISSAAMYGAAPVIIKGLGVGMLSVTVPTFTIAVTILACNALSGLYGVSLAAVGMLSTLGITLATDAFGPVADNAGGIAEMAGLPPSVRTKTDALDSLGNTTAATGKGFAIGSAVLTSVGLIAAYLATVGLGNNFNLSVAEPVVLSGVMIGAMLPFVFASLTMLSVDRASRAIIREVRLQFLMAPDLLDDTKDRFAKYTVQRSGQEFTVPNTQECVGIATASAVEEMVMPGTIAVFSPVITGFLLGARGLSGLLIGSLTSGFMLALTMSNAGGAWDNAKKWVEHCANESDENGSFTQYGIKKTKVLLNNYKLDAEGNRVLENGAPAHSKFPWTAFGITAEDAADDELVARKAEELAELYHDRHSAVVTGDTVGDPFKDTSGPALNILIKLMSVVSLVFAPAYKALGEHDGFGPTGWWVALLIAVAACGAVFIIEMVFARRRAATDEEFNKVEEKFQAIFEAKKRELQAAEADEEAGEGDAGEGVAGKEEAAEEGEEGEEAAADSEDVKVE